MTRSSTAARRPHPRAARGFTLVELVVVIAILGILAAVALPRFTSLQQDARIAKIQAVGGAIRAAAAQVKAMAVVRGVDCATASIAASGSPVNLERNGIGLAYCYPDTSGDGIVVAANLQGAAMDGLTFDTSTAGTVVVSLSLSASSNTPWANCNVRYTVPSAANGQPTVTVTTSGC